MLSKIKSFGLHGIKGYEVSLEIDINNGLPGIEIVGLPDAAIKESKERVRSAIKNSGFLFTAASRRCRPGSAPGRRRRGG